MLEIFLIEDDLLKISQLDDFLKETLDKFSIGIYESYHSGLKATLQFRPNLIILDMTLPTFDRKPNSREGRLRPLGGYELMRKLKLHSCSSKVIVVTQLESFPEDNQEITFKELSERCHHEFPNLFLGAVQFHQNDLAWQDELKNLLEILKC